MSDGIGYFFAFFEEFWNMIVNNILIFSNRLVNNDLGRIIIGVMLLGALISGVVYLISIFGGD